MKRLVSFRAAEAAQRRRTVEESPAEAERTLRRDRFGNAAVVRLEMTGWIDYLELAKFGDDWKIVNVLWERKHV